MRENFYKQYLVNLEPFVNGGPGVHEYYDKLIKSEIQKVVDGEQSLDDFATNTRHIAGTPASGASTLNYIRDRILEYYPN